MSPYPQDILHVDDSEVDREIVKAALETQADIRLYSYEKGDKAIACLVDIVPDLILLDLRMPDIDGADFLEFLRNKETFKDVPVVFLTGMDKVSMNAKYRRLGVIGVIHKPIKAGLFLEELAVLWKVYRDS